MEAEDSDRTQADDSRDMMLDGNAVGGVLQEIFGTEMTATPGKCANCGREGELATLLAFTQAPGVVLRCPACGSVMLTVVETPDAVYFEARGVAYFRFARATGKLNQPVTS